MSDLEGTPFRFKSYKDCPDRAKHFEAVPKDFNPNTGRSATMRQVRCPTCGFFAMWEPR